MVQYSYRFFLILNGRGGLQDLVDDNLRVLRYACRILVACEGLAGYQQANPNQQVMIHRPAFWALHRLVPEEAGAEKGAGTSRGPVVAVCRLASPYRLASPLRLASPGLVVGVVWPEAVVV